MAQTAVSRKGGKSIADVDTVNKCNIDGHMVACRGHVQADVCYFMIVWFCRGVASLVLTSLSAPDLFLTGFQTTKADPAVPQSQQQPQSRTAFRATEWLKCFRLNPVSSWTLWAQLRWDGAKKCEQCQWAQRWVKWAIQRTDAVKIEDQSFVHNVMQHNTLVCRVL